MSLNPPIKDWNNKRVWIVGASTGIGEALAQLLTQKGARVALSARNQEKLAALNQALPNSLALPLDFTDAKATSQAWETLERSWGGVDVVVAMAGNYFPMRADAFDLETAKKQFEINVFGVMHILDVTLPALRAQKSGHIALVSSVAGYRGLPKALVYGASKAALINMAEAMYIDLHPEGIGVHLINPGFVDTPLTQKNDFEMPYLMTAEAAAAEIVKGFAQGAFEIHFPKAFTRWLRLMRILPYAAYFPQVARFTGLGKAQE